MSPMQRQGFGLGLVTLGLSACLPKSVSKVESTVSSNTQATACVGLQGQRFAISESRGCLHRIAGKQY